MTRLLSVFLMAMLLLGGMAAPRGVAEAAPKWCEDDPLLTVTTPWNTTVGVHLTIMAMGLEHQADVGQALYFVDSLRLTQNDKALDVEVHVIVPKLDPYEKDFLTRVVAKDDTGGTLDAAAGRSGDVMKLKFRLFP